MPLVHRLRRSASRAPALALALAALAHSALAQEAAEPPPRGFAEVRSLVLEASLDVAARTADLSAARRDLERAERDPLATTLERIQAHQAVAAAGEALEAAVQATHVTALQRVVAVLEALDAEEGAAGAAEIAGRQLAADRVRAEAGVITDADLARATSDFEAARRAVSDAAAATSFAWSELSLIAGRSAEALASAGLAPLGDALPELPALDAVLTLDASGHVGIASAERALEVAQVRLAGADHEGTAPNALEALRADVADARRRVDDVRATATLQLRSTYQAAVQAYARYGDAVEADAAAETTLAAQRIRADAGEVAPLALRQAELDRARAGVARRTALHAAWTAWFRLEGARLGS